ncbi:MAG: outer membrane beta-barrel protein [Holosporales bacterium]|nr:outer membrane beta-barrel protein [Holosporales bacterium]
MKSGKVSNKLEVDGMLGGKLKYWIGAPAAALLVPAADAVTCPQGGFYVGVTVGADFAKVKAKVEGKDIQNLVDKITKAVVDAMNKQLKALADAQSVIGADAGGVAKDVAAWVKAALTQSGVIHTGLSKVPKIGVGESGSLLAVIETCASYIGTDKLPLFSLLKLIMDADPAFKSNSAIKEAAELDKVGNDQLYIAGLRAIAQDKTKWNEFLKGFEELSKAIADKSKVLNLYENSTSSAEVDGDVLATPKCVLADLRKHLTDLNSAESKGEELLTTCRNAAGTSTTLLPLFYVDGNKQKGNLTADQVLGKFNELGESVTKEELEELGADAKGQINKSATGFAIGVIGGYKHRFNDFTVFAQTGFELALGGKVKVHDKKVDKKSADAVTVRKQLGVPIELGFGYSFSPELEVSLFGGVAYTRFKVDTSNMVQVLDHLKDLKKIGAELNKKYYSAADTKKDAIDLTVFDGKQASDVLKSHNAGKFIPVVGLGLEWRFSPDASLLVRYSYSPSTKIIKAEKCGLDIKYEDHQVKVGVLFHIN